MTWKPEVFVDGDWGQNALVFETRTEAETYAKDLFTRWLATTDWRAVEIDEPVTHRITAERVMERIEQEE